MGSVIKSQGTDLYWASGPTAVTRAVCITGISGLGGARDQIETSCLDNTTDKTFVGGLGTPGQVTVPFNVHKDEVSHAALLALKDSGETVSWGIYSSDSVTAPTAVGSVMQTVASRASAIFSGYVSDVTIDIAGNDIWKGSITIQRSGDVDWDLTTV
ncbi:hypothetical protein J2W30_003704 [Variovorax boronicumulans]|uniref:phage tail tube protein n=1 Tax=Variovorax boronicumulans TaxID=436515 RepID=UPI002785A2A3|nr:phage tail tube protein [Variovorax boronicumulans]MDQ0035931.1 hypothetical protein [Variovorax boronicumulans]